MIFAPASPYGLSLNAIEKIYTKIQEKSHLTTPDFECTMSVKELTFEQSAALFSVFGGNIFPYILLEIKVIQMKA